MFKYFPHTDADIRDMLAKINASSIDELFQDVPKDVFFDGDYDLNEAMSEIELRKHIRDIAGQNREFITFAGLGIYDHYEPSVINHLLSRQEFLTSYTPYQPEVSQGTLQYIFEFQSMIQTLTGMDAANASMYDGSTATSEACFMAEAITRRKKIICSETVNPHTIAVIRTYLHFKGLELVIAPQKDGETDLEALNGLVDDFTAAIVVQKPNFLGIIEDVSAIAGIAHQKGALLIENADISTLAVLKTPREDGADIAVGDCQSLGMPMACGGPTVGYMATLRPHVRKLPGRICGMSKDKSGNRAFVLTLQAREQHIRREKANSNICSNQSLMALYVTIYLALMGKQGLKEVNELSYQGAHYLKDKLLATGKFQLAYDKPFLKEFVMRTNLPIELIQKALLEAGIFGAVPLEVYNEDYKGLVAFAVTEKRTKAEIDELCRILGGLSW